MKNYNLNSREKFEPGPGFEPLVVERQARDLEVRGSNPGTDSNFSLEFKFHSSIIQKIRPKYLVSRIRRRQKITANSKEKKILAWTRIQTQVSRRAGVSAN